MAILLTLVLFTAPVSASPGAVNTLLVVNADSWMSLAVANEYLRLRPIPPQNILYLPLGEYSGQETISVTQFRQKILAPVLAAIKARKLNQRIDLVAYSADIPTAVNVHADLKNGKSAKIHRPTCSLVGLTFFYQAVMNKDAKTYLNLSNNRYCRGYQVVSANMKMPVLTQDQQKLFTAVQAALRQRDYDAALQSLKTLIEAQPRVGLLQILLARAAANGGKPELALKALKNADALGVRDPRLRGIPEFARLKNNKQAATLLEKLAQGDIRIQPGVGFRGMVHWNRNHLPSRSPEDPQYLLAISLAVTSGRGNSLKEVRNYLSRSVAADGTPPKGKIYFMKNGDIRSKTRQWGFNSAVTLLNEIHVPAVVADGVLPKNAEAAGLMTGRPTLNVGLAKCQISAGALCENFTSFGGIFNYYTGQTPLTEFLRYGAAGSSGTVVEPYAVQAKFPTPFIQYYYASGLTLVESFYLSLNAPYQLAIVGEPLCSPWCKRPQLSLLGLGEAGNGPPVLKGVVKLTPRAKDVPDAPVRAYMLLVDGFSIAIVKAGDAFNWDTAAFPDGYHELTLVALSNNLQQTQTEKRYEALVNNHNESLSLAAVKNSFALGQDVELKLGLNAKDARHIKLWHNGRIIAQQEAGEKGQLKPISIPTAKLGLGKVRLTAWGMETAQSPKPRVISRPMELTIVPPTPLKPKEFPKAVAPGVRFTGPKKQILIKRTWKSAPLIKAGVQKGDPLTVDAVVTAKHAGLYQVQIYFDGPLLLEVNGEVAFKAAENRGWALVPMSLTPGEYHLKVSGKVQTARAFKIAFGRQGTRPLDDKIAQTFPVEKK